MLDHVYTRDLPPSPMPTHLSTFTSNTNTNVSCRERGAVGSLGSDPWFLTRKLTLLWFFGGHFYVHESVQDSGTSEDLSSLPLSSGIMSITTARQTLSKLMNIP
jgi:hypothetical protein